jgi:hypothetical protein
VTDAGHIHNRYSYEKEKQQALEAWERKLKSIIAGMENKVVCILSKQKRAA